MIQRLFPEVKYEKTKEEQLEKVIEELGEIQTAKTREEFLYECIDLMHATANLLYKTNYTIEEIDKGILYVQKKNRIRGKYK